MPYYNNAHNQSFHAPDRPKGLIIGVTGHRPNKLWGYNLNETHYQNVAKALENLTNQLDARGIITGMALGFDQLCAQVAIRNKNVRSIAAIPCEGQERTWPQQSQNLYHDLLSKMDDKALVSSGSYAPEKMHRRNQWIVDHADVMVALWDGTPGGTGHCVHSAEIANKPIFRLDPNDVSPYETPSFTPYNDKAKALLTAVNKPVELAPNTDGIPVVPGDVTLAHDCIIVHQVNCQDTTDDPVSRALFTKWPELDSAYHALAQSVPQPEARHGLVTEVDVEPDTTVCLVFSQLNNDGFNVMSDADIDKLVKGVQAVTKMHPDKTVCIPEGLGYNATDLQWTTVNQRLAELPVCAIHHDHDITPKLPTRQALERRLKPQPNEPTSQVVVSCDDDIYNNVDDDYGYIGFSG